MGGTVGQTVEIEIGGDHLEGASELRFSDPRVTAEPVRDDQNAIVANRYAVTIAKDCPVGLVEARVLCRRGVSSPRIFSVSSLPETTQTEPSPGLETAFPLELNSICNATMSARAVNHYRFDCEKGCRVVVDCASTGIDSKLKAVLIIADDQGRDLMVQRRGDVMDFTAPETGTYVIKVHELTFKGGADFFYRLSLRTIDSETLAAGGPSTATVSSFSWPPVGLPTESANEEAEPNDSLSEAQSIQLPCDISGSFATAADVDVFGFEASKGEVWWVEVASERLGRPTDPSVLVQRIVGEGNEATFEDVAELNDIPNPVKVSSNAYAYDGPPYHAGSPDVLGKFEVPEDGRYQIRLTDLFGGTRNDPRNVYRLVVRRATPDFALVSWAMHMALRNGDRNALSKPLALRGGTTMPLEVVVVRRDGFDGPIELFMENLPDGVTAQGITIAAGENRGLMLLTAADGAPPGVADAKFYGRAQIDGQAVVRTCRLASMAWPVANHWSEIPSPRLLSGAVVSVSEGETAPITIAARESKLWEAVEGQKLEIPLLHMRRSEFSGAVLNASTMGKGFERFKLEIPLDADSSKAVIDLATLKTPPGEYVIAFYGGAVAKYVDSIAQSAAQKSDQGGSAQSKDIADIVVSEPIAIRVHPAEKK